MLRKWNVFAENVGECLISTFAFEWRSSKEHFVDQNAKGPPVNGTCMAAAFDHLWCNVFLCTDERVGPEVGYA